MTIQQLPSLPCLCASLRRATRALSHFYAQELRPLGLHASQFTILQVLSRTGEISQGQLGAILAMDSTTLTRTLKIMTRERWIAERSGKDRRERLLKLSPGGRTMLKDGTPAWERAQSQVRRQLGKSSWDDVFRLTNQITEIASNEEESL